MPSIKTIEIPRREVNQTKNYPLSIRLTLADRRRIDLLASIQGYTDTSSFVRAVLTRVSDQALAA